MYSRYAKPSIPLQLTSYCRVQIPTPRGVMCTVGVQILKKLAWVHRPGFIFLFVHLENMGVRESEANTRAKRASTSLRWR